MSEPEEETNTAAEEETTAGEEEAGEDAPLGEEEDTGAELDAAGEEEGEGGENEPKEDEEEDKEKEEGEEDEDKPPETPEDIIPSKPLTQEIIGENISLLCKIGTGLAHAYCRLEVKEQELSDIDILATYIHLRYVDLSINSLKDISSLNNLSHLLTLKLEKNLLLSAELTELPYLQIANFAHNRIKNTEGIEHPLLESLTLSWNNISQITSLNPNKLQMLHTLELRANKLTSTRGIVIPTLKFLYLAQNQINDLEDLNQLQCLQMLHMRDNHMATLDGFSENMKALRYINMRGNHLANRKELLKLQVLPLLDVVIFSECPISDEDDYRIETLINLRRLARLDKEPYTDEEKQEAEEIHEQRRLETGEEEEGGEGESGESPTTAAEPVDV